MKDYININKKWWDAVTPIHANSKLYNLAYFKKGKSSLQAIETEELGNVKGKTLLHLLCHFGMDTLSFARRGAIVTGVDLSNKSITFAQKLSKEINIPATFICSDVYKLPNILDEEYDIVFASYGALCWLSEIEQWAKIIHRFLKKGGVFYLIDLHPFTNILSCDLKMSYNYFDTEPNVDDSPGTYADWNAKIKGNTYLWNHTISAVINALIDQGLQLQYIHEFPFTMYNQFPGFMKKNRKGQYVLKNSITQIPLLFSLKATK